MAVKVLELLGEYAGPLGIIFGIPYATLIAAVVALWRSNQKNTERMMTIVETQVTANTKMASGFDSLKEVLRLRGG